MSDLALSADVPLDAESLRVQWNPTEPFEQAEAVLVLRENPHFGKAYELVVWGRVAITEDVLTGTSSERFDRALDLESSGLAHDLKNHVKKAYRAARASLMETPNE